MPPTAARRFSIAIVVLLFALACALPASAARFAPRGTAARALALCEQRRFAAAESLLASQPAPPRSPDAALSADAAALEYARLVARTEAPLMCDTTWTWRPAQAIAALERHGADAATLARAELARARVEFRLGHWRDVAPLVRAAFARMGEAGLRDDLLRYQGQLLLVEALSVERVVEPRAELERADSLARVLGDAAAPWRGRQLRLNGNLLWIEGRVPEATRVLGEAVKAADAVAPAFEPDVCIALVLQGTLEAFTNAPLGDRHKSEAATRAEAALGLADERALFVLGRSVANLRDPARLPVMDAKFEEAHRALRERGFEDLAGVWNLDYFHSRVNHFLARYARSRELLTHALEVSRRWNGPDNIREMYTHIDFGNSWHTEHDPRMYTEAFPHWRSAVEIASKLPRSFVNDPHVTRMNLAFALGDAGQVRESREEFAAIWTSYADRDGETARLCSQPAYLAARASRALGDTAAATLWYARALKPFEANDSGEREEVSRVRESIALFEWWRRHEGRAFEIAREATRLRRQVIEETAPWLPDGDAVRFAADRRFVAGLLSTIAVRQREPDPARLQDAWLALVRGRSLVLEAMLRRARVQVDTSAGGNAAAPLRRELAAQVLAALRAPDTRVEQARRDSLREEIRRREMGLPSRSLESEEISVAQASARLGRDGVLVSYTRFGLFDHGDAGKLAWQPREWYAAMVLRGGEQVPVAIELVPADTLDAAVAAYRAALLAGGDSPAARAAGARVRALAWTPLARALAGRSHVYVVPDGELLKLNWYALPSGRDGFLVDEPVVIHRLGSERDLMAPAAPRPGEGLLALGGMEYGAGPGDAPAAAPAGGAKRRLPSCRSFLDERFTPLPATLGEARAVSALGRRFARDTSRVTLLTGAAADEAAFKRLAPGRRVVHLATHAFFLGADCAPQASADVLARNPLVFSGIALANANAWRDAPAQGGEDGLLTAEELAGMRLEGVEWLVLSGCESGMGQVQPWEGVYGLPRAARMAGVRTLVMSLLPVDDEASRVFMQALYEAHFTRDEDSATAIRTASRKVLGWLRASHRAADPKQWAAFVALGE